MNKYKLIFSLSLIFILLFSSCFVAFADIGDTYHMVLDSSGHSAFPSNFFNFFDTSYSFSISYDTGSSTGTREGCTPIYLNGKNYILLDNQYWYPFIFNLGQFLCFFAFDNNVSYDSLPLAIGYFHISKNSFNDSFNPFSPDPLLLNVLSSFDISYIKSSSSDNYYLSSAFYLSNYIDLPSPTERLFNNLSEFVGSSSSGMLQIWTSIITFAMSELNRIVLLSCLAWIFVTGIGGIRRLVIGL